MKDSSSIAIRYVVDDADSDRVCIQAIIDEVEVGAIILETIHDAHSEFEGAIDDEEISEDMVNQLFPDDVIQSINHLKVNTEYQRLGIGDGLMNQALDYFELQGVSTIYLNACPMGCCISLKNLTDFYESYDFKPIIYGGPNIEMVRAA
jgi:ribosomal protein S18 acetylase RimI-like enzyme